MAVSFDHIALPSRDDEASARFLGSVLGLPVARDGAEDEIPCVRVAEGRQVLFQRAETFTSHHAAFRVSPDEFVEVVERLRSMTVPFGNDPDAPTNGLVSDPLGGHGRVYFFRPERPSLGGLRVGTAPASADDVPVLRRAAARSGREGG